MRYLGSVVIDFRLVNLTGLRIGGSKENFEIGGIDNPVIKLTYPLGDYPAGTPYIPGSSIKGKMRSQLEWLYNRVEYMVKKAEESEESERSKVVDKAGKPCSCGECQICIVFGTGNADTLYEKQPGPPRARFYDIYPDKETVKKLQEELGDNIFTEIKTENQINRITSGAHPRKVERVPAGAVFEGRIIYDLYKRPAEDVEKEVERLKVLLEGMMRLEDNFLGGYGSRGSGRVKFKEIEIRFNPPSYYRGEGQYKSIKPEAGEKWKSVADIVNEFDRIKEELIGEISEQ